MEFKLPDIGEGIHEGEIVKWRVKEGDSISENAPLVEVMTDKATVEIPSPTKGKIQKIHFKEGQTVQIDTVIVTIQEEGARVVSTLSSSPLPSPHPDPLQQVERETKEGDLYLGRGRPRKRSMDNLNYLTLSLYFRRTLR